MDRRLNPLWAVMLISSLSACGGGGDSSTDSNSGGNGPDTEKPAEQSFEITVIDGYLKGASITSIENGRCDAQLGEQTIVATTGAGGVARIPGSYSNHILCAYAIKGTTVDEDSIDGTPITESFVMTSPAAASFDVISPYTSMVAEKLRNETNGLEGRYTPEVIKQARQTVADSLKNITDNSELIFGDYVELGLPDENGDMLDENWQSKTLHNIARSYVYQQAKIIKQLNNQIVELKQEKGKDTSYEHYLNVYDDLLTELIDNLTQHANENVDSYRQKYIEKDLVGAIDFNDSAVSLPDWDASDIEWTIPQIDIVESISFSLPKNNLNLGQGQSLNKISASYPNNVKRNIFTGIEWQSSDDSVASIEGNRIQTLATGTTEIIASYNDNTYSVTLTVLPPAIEKLKISLDTSGFRKGDSLALDNIVAVYTDKTEEVVNNDITWESSDNSVALIENGQLIAKKTGSVTLSATYQDLVVTQQIEVLAAQATEITLNIDTSGFHAGTLLPLNNVVSALLSDGSTETVNSGVIWSSTIDGFLQGNSLFGLAQGSYPLTASYQGISETIEVTVLEAALKTLSITLDTSTIRKGDTLSLSGVVGTYTDGEQKNITQGINWSSGNASLATVEGNALQAIKTGTFQLFAEYQNLSASKTVTILAPSLIGIEITNAPSSIPKGETLPLPVLTGVFSDESRQIISNDIEWTTSEPTIATITDGSINALKQGSVTIGAKYNNEIASFSLTVEQAKPESISLQVNNSDFNKGEQLPLQVIATLTDATTQIVNDELEWEIGDTAIITVSDNTLVAVAEGTSTLSVKHQGLTSDTVDITVLPPTLATVTPDILDGTLELTEGQIIPQEFTFTFSDGTTESFDTISYYPTTGRADESNIDKLKVNNDEKTIRAIRSGELTLQISNIPERMIVLFDTFAPDLDFLPYSNNNIQVNISDNPDVYQWHRTNDTVVPSGAVEMQTIVSRDTIYRFWKVDNGPFYDIYIGEVDKNGVSNFTKVIENRLLINNEMLDGGGHGYFALVSENSVGVRFIQAYNLTSGELSDPLVIPDGQFSTSQISISDNDQSVLFDNTGTPIVTDYDFSAKSTIVYRYNMIDQTWEKGDTVKGSVVQLQSHPDHIVIRDTTGFSQSVQTLPTYHFVNRNTGLLETSIPMAKLTERDKNCSLVPRLIALGEDFKFGAFCVQTDGYHLWDDINLPPTGIYADPLQGELIRKGDTSVVNVLPNGNILGQNYLMEVNNENFVQINELNPATGEVTTTRLDASNWRLVKQPYKYDFDLTDNAHFGQLNPNVDNEWVQILGSGMAVYNGERWTIDREMYELPVNVDTNYSLIRSKETWYILNDTGNGSQIWYFQHRNPNQ